MKWITIRFLWNNLFDAGTLTASHSAAGYPVTNIQLRWHTRHWRSTGQINTGVINDLLEQKDIGALIVKYHNFLTGQNVRIQATNIEDNWGFLNQALSITTGKPIVKFWETPETYRWWRLFMPNANPAGYDRVGRMFLGLFSQPSYDISRPPHFISIDPSVTMASSGGQKSSDQREHFQTISFEWDMIPAADKAIFEAIFAHVGKSKPYFVCRDWNDAANTTYYVQNISNFDYPPTIHNWCGLNIDVETMR